MSLQRTGEETAENWKSFLPILLSKEKTLEETHPLVKFFPVLLMSSHHP